MRKLRLGVFMLAGLAFAACSFDGSKKTSTAPVPTKDKTKVEVAALGAKTDKVCGMELSEETLEDTTLYNGKIYGFCNIGCKEEFLKTPDKYLSQK